MVRKIKVISLLVVYLFSTLALAFGLFKFFEAETVYKANLLLKEDKPFEAFKIFERLEKHKIYLWVDRYNLLDPVWYYSWGLSALRTGDYKKARIVFEKAAKRFQDPYNRASAYFNQGEARLWQWDAGAFENAAESYTEALRQNPDFLLAKKRLEWLKQADLVKSQKEEQLKKGTERREKSEKEREGKDKSDQLPQEKENKYKSSEGKQRRGY